MKKIILSISIIMCLQLTSPVAFALSPTPAPQNAEVKDNLDKQINQLKEKIASRVSELNLVEKRGIIGTVEEVKGNQITLTDPKGETRFIDVDELTKFTSLGNKNFGLSDLTKGTKISILGNYNKQSKRMLARYISTYTSPQYITGTITAIDPKNYQITVQTLDQQTTVVDINTVTTKINSYTTADKLVRYTFAKLAVGDKVFVVGTPDKTDPKMLTSLRIIDYIELPKDPALAPQTQLSPTIPAVSTTPLPTAGGNRRINQVR